MLPAHRLWGLMVCVILTDALSARAVGFENHRIVARQSIDALPTPIVPLFVHNRLALEERAVEPVAVWDRDPELRRRRTWHRVSLDLEAEEQSREARLKAAERFPRTLTRANEHYRSHHLRDGGLLPWGVEELYNELVQAWKDGRAEDIVRTAGYLVHFAADCASPFAATCDYDGRMTDNLYLGLLRPGDDYYAHQSVQYRFDLELVRRNTSRYAEAIDLGSSDYDPVSEPVGRAFEVLLGSLGCVDEVLAADREILHRLGVSDGPGFAARADEYYLLLDERCGELCVARLRAGAVLAAGLIGGAWEAAGKPDLDIIQARGLPASAPASSVEAGPAAPEPRPPAQFRFVGSRSSNVFHRIDCPHAARISPENRVYFETAQEALDQGRRPCKTCNPSD
jgi:hypothetical protein